MASGILSISRTGTTPSYISFSALWGSVPDAATNTSAVTVQIVAQNNSTTTPLPGITTTTGVTIRANGGTGEQKSNTVTFSLAPSSSQTIFTQTFTVTHDMDGNASITLSASISGGITGTGAGTGTLDHIAQQSVVPILMLASTTETGATINWATSAPIDYLWYKIDSQAWTANGAITGRSGSFTLTGLYADTMYSVKIKVRAAESQAESESEPLGVKTNAYPHATNMPDFLIGSSVAISLYNPLGRSVVVKMLDRNGTQVGSISTSGTAVSGFNGATTTAALYASIPNQHDGTYSIRVTYAGQNQTRTGGKYIVHNNVNRPTLDTPTYMDTSLATLVTDDDQIIVQNKSTAKITVTGLGAQNGASVASVSAAIPGQTITLTISGTSAEGTFAATNSATNVSCVVTVTDSRGVTNSKTITLTVAAYHDPEVTLTVHRHNNYYSPTDITVDVDMSVVGDNEITINYGAQSVDGQDTYTGTMNNHDTVTETLDNERDWFILVMVTDRFGSVVNTTYYLSKGMPIIFFDKDKYAIGVNCFPAHDNTFEVDGAVLNRNVMTATASAAQTTGTSSQKINVAAGETVGDQLTIDSGGVKIGAKLSKVLVSANVHTLSPAAGNHSVTIKKGATAVAYAYRTLTASGNTESINISPVLVSVAANDNLSVYVQGFASTEYVGIDFTVEAMA